MENKEMEQRNEEISRLEEISSQLADTNRILTNQRDAALRTMLYDAGERRFKIQKVRSDIDKNAQNAVAKTIICGAGVLAFTAFASVAVQKMGLDNSIIAELQQNHQLMVNQPISENGNMVNEIWEYLQNYVITVFGPLNKYLTLENAQNFANELGPVGGISGLMALVTGKSAGKNFNEWAKKNRELDVMRETMPQDVAAGRKAFTEFSFRTMLESLKNTFGNSLDAIIKSCSPNFNNLKQSIKTMHDKNKLNMMASKMQKLNETVISEENTNGRSR